MIPQALKWVGAVVGLLILVVVVAPLALDAIFGTVEFDDDSGLFETSEEEPDPLDGIEADPDALDEPDGSAEEDDADAAEGGEDVDADDAEVVTDGEDADGDEDADEDADEDGDDADPSGETYVVQGGDTLYAIAEEVYGDGSRWGEIAEANGIGDQSSLTVGQELVVP